jgi:hypothetical protein
MFVSVTRLRIRSFWYFLPFLWMTLRSQRQVTRASGFLGGRLLMDAKRTFWTLTTWDDERSMKAFRGAGPHGKAMRRLAQWCDEASYAHWTTASAAIPDWPEAYEQLVSLGHLSRVEHPSPDHEARHFPKPRIGARRSNLLKPK